MLDFIYSTKKRRELEHILKKKKATHNERIYFVSFLAYCGLSSKDISDIIDKHNGWDDFDADYSLYQIRSLCSDINPSNYSKHNLHQDNINRTIYCRDISVFGKLNKEFFKDAVAAVYEYELGKYNYEKMIWNPLKYALYRTIEGKNGLLLYVDLDSNDVGVCYEVAKQIFNIDIWDSFKFSGGGFHLCKRTRLKEYADLFDELRDVYFSVRTNLVSFVLDSDCKKAVNIDSTSIRKRRLVRAYGINLKYNNYTIPVTNSMSVNDIVDISKDIKKVEKYVV